MVGKKGSIGGERVGVSANDGIMDEPIALVGQGYQETRPAQTLYADGLGYL